MIEHATFSFSSVNDALYSRHPNLSSEWSTLGWNETTATATYMIEGEPDEVVTVDLNFSVTVSEKLIKEMDTISNKHLTSST